MTLYETNDHTALVTSTHKHTSYKPSNAHNIYCELEKLSVHRATSASFAGAGVALARVALAAVLGAPGAHVESLDGPFLWCDTKDQRFSSGGLLLRDQVREHVASSSAAASADVPAGAVPTAARHLSPGNW